MQDLFILYVRHLYFAYKISFFSEWVVFILFLLFILLCQEFFLFCRRNLSFVAKGYFEYYAYFNEESSS
ncbi:MAG: hypothetical protein D8B52_01000 [Prevotella sp.]|nr:MAG: hypothetical protein D8B52_01000 [Prevotella sp.]